MTMPNPSDLRQSLLAFFMILFFGSTMSLVWTFTVIVPFIKGTNYGNGSCSLAGINGVPPVCRNHTYFNKINLFTNNGVSVGDESLVLVTSTDSFLEMVQRRWILRRNDFSIGLYPILCQVRRQVFYSSRGWDRYNRHVSRSNPLFRHPFKNSSKSKFIFFLILIQLLT